VLGQVVALSLETRAEHRHELICLEVGSKRAVRSRPRRPAFARRSTMLCHPPLSPRSRRLSFGLCLPIRSAVHRVCSVPGCSHLICAPFRNSVGSIGKVRCKPAYRYASTVAVPWKSEDHPHAPHAQGCTLASSVHPVAARQLFSRLARCGSRKPQPHDSPGAPRGSSGQRLRSTESEGGAVAVAPRVIGARQAPQAAAAAGSSWSQRQAPMATTRSAGCGEGAIERAASGRLPSVALARARAARRSAGLCAWPQQSAEVLFRHAGMTPERRCLSPDDERNVLVHDIYLGSQPSRSLRLPLLEAAESSGEYLNVSSRDRRSEKTALAGIRGRCGFDVVVIAAGANQQAGRRVVLALLRLLAANKQGCWTIRRSARTSPPALSKPQWRHEQKLIPTRRPSATHIQNFDLGLGPEASCRASGPG